MRRWALVFPPYERSERMHNGPQEVRRARSAKQGRAAVSPSLQELSSRIADVTQT